MNAAVGMTNVLAGVRGYVLRGAVDWWERNLN
jgi:hypothetical protein